MSSHPITIVAYHYVRDVKHSRYPTLKTLDLSSFKDQLLYLRKHYTFVSLEECFEALEGHRPLPARAVLLTFDDGFLDHYVTVFPLLKSFGISACFAPPGQAIMERKVLDVHKIHFIMASTSIDTLVPEVFHQLDRHRDAHALLPNETLFKKLAISNRFNTKEEAFVKYLLQEALPTPARGLIVKALFEQFVPTDEKTLAEELYMTLEQLRDMVRHQMSICSHGWSHQWLNSLSKPEQAEDIDRSLEFLRATGTHTGRWAMCYPSGVYSKDTLELLMARNCLMAFTVEANVAVLNRQNALEMPRLDTKDLPCAASEPPNPWTQKILND